MDIFVSLLITLVVSGLIIGYAALVVIYGMVILGVTGAVLAFLLLWHTVLDIIRS